MMKQLLNWRRGSQSRLEDVTDVWNACHPHLQPRAGARLNGQLATSAFELCAHIRLRGGGWVEMARLRYEPASGRFFWPRSERERMLVEHPKWKDLPVDAVDARLWMTEPTLINIEPTTRCNFNCWYCVGRHMKQADIRLEDFASMLDHYPKLKTIALVGEGEPLMHTGFFDMARMAKERGIRVMIISNGSTLSKSVVAQLCETEVAYVAVSVDSFDPQTFADSRLDGDLDKVWRGVRRLREYRDAHGYVYPKIALKGTLFSHTLDQMPEIAARARSCGVEIIESFQPLNPMKSYVKIYPSAHLKQLDALKEVSASITRDTAVVAQSLMPFSEFCDSSGIDFFPSVRANPLRKNCNETGLYSLLSGDVTPCCQIKTPMSSMWNVFERPVVDILADPDYENVRFNLWNGLFLDSCEGCWKTQ